MPFDATFNANDFTPQQGGGGRHPVGNKFPFKITNTEVKPTKDGKGGLYEVELSSPAGSIKNNYNLWNENETARKIAQQQLSALCHAVKIYQIDFKNDGKALLGGQGLMDVGFQKGHEPSADKPEGGYVEVKKVYDVQGNEPGKEGQAQQSQQQQPQQNYQQQEQPNPPQSQQGAPQVQQGWSGSQQQASQTNAPQTAAGGWGGQQQQTAPQQSAPQNNGGGWQQGSAPQQAPWGSR